MAVVGSESEPLRVAVIGSGPSGFYAAEALFKSEFHVEVGVFDRLPTPFGLLRGGVAPDHQRMKSVAKAYERIGENPGFKFWGNVTVGVDVSVSTLASYYHAIIFAYGAESDRSLGIPGESLERSYTATEFVGWYNGHPDYQDREFDLSQKKVAIIGQGNVAVDVVRILAKPIEELKKTDITERAISVLAMSQVEDIYMIGRRGPVQAAFTELEVKELGEIENCEVIVNEEEVVLSETDKETLALPKMNRANKNIRILSEYAGKDGESGSAKKRIHIKFFRSPTVIGGDEGVESLVLEKNELVGKAGSQKSVSIGETETLDVGAIFRSIGYRGTGIEGVPYDEKRGVIPNNEGRVKENDDVVVGLYATGWIKRGPSGVIGTNRPDSVETVRNLIEDVPLLGQKKVKDLGLLSKELEKRGVQVVRFSDWKKIDQEEIRRGEEMGKPREKFTSIAEMLAYISKEA